MSEAASEKPEILVVDDSKVIRLAATKMLAEDYVVHVAIDGLDGWTQLEENPAISVVFTDMQMPEMNGLELLEKIRQSDDERIKELSVIMITGEEDSEAAKKEVYDRGATDFVSKPFDSIDLISRAKSYARLQKKVEALELKAGIDKLTGLFNADHFVGEAERALSFAKRHNLSIAVVYIEIDDFQNLFLNVGKNVAQQIIIAVSKKLNENLRTEDVAARVGLARFALLLPCTNKETANATVERIHKVANKLVFDTGKEKLKVSFATGISAPEVNDESTLASLMQMAEDLLHQNTDTAEVNVARLAPEPVPAPETVVDEPAPIPEPELSMQEVISRLIDGEFDSIPIQQLESMQQQLKPFFEYMEKQSASQLTASGDSI